MVDIATNFAPFSLALEASVLHDNEYNPCNNYNRDEFDYHRGEA